MEYDSLIDAFLINITHFWGQIHVHVPVTYMFFTKSDSNLANIFSEDKDSLIFYLPIETGRWNNLVTARENKTSTECNIDEIGMNDEFHYTLNCQSLNDDRKRCFPIKYITRRNIISFKYIM